MQHAPWYKDPLYSWGRHRPWAQTLPWLISYDLSGYGFKLRQLRSPLETWWRHGRCRAVVSGCYKDGPLLYMIFGEVYICLCSLLKKQNILDSSFSKNDSQTIQVRKPSTNHNVFISLAKCGKSKVRFFFKWNGDNLPAIVWPPLALLP